jgi:hypothetical protein
MGDSMSTIINATTTNGVVIQPDNSGSLVLQTNNGTTALTISTAQNTTLAGKLTTASSGIEFSDASSQTAAASPYVLKNRIINGAMEIDQRNAGASVSVGNGSVTFITDRWNVYEDTSGSMTSQQSSTAPAGFINSLLLTVTSAGTATASQLCRLQQRVEGLNVSDLAWGSASAKTITISFWVRSSLTGTYCVNIRNSAVDRSYVATYTISAANTWEQKSVTIAGDTSGTWLTTNGVGMYVSWDLGAGSNANTTAGSWIAGNKENTSAQANWIGTSGATFYITGVQLEQNTSATPFERRLYNQELANCQRYYQVIGGVNGGFPMATSYFSAGSQTARFPISFPVVTRATPTVTKNGTWDGNASQPSAGYISSAGFAMELNSSGSGMQYSFPNSTDDTFTIAAEL